MSVRYARFAEPPAEGKTLLIGPMNSMWKDVSKKPQEPSESQKGAYIPSWPQLIGVSGALAIMTTITHLKHLGRF